MPFRAPDYYAIEELLTDEERQVRDTTRRFVDEEFMPRIVESYRAGTFPNELIPRIAELGLFGPTLPEEYGCAGVSSVAYGLICQELERGDSGLRSFASVQSSLVMYPIWAFGSDEHKKSWLPRLAKGEAIGCFGLTEPDFGSNPSGMRTTARRADGGFVLDGVKRWITNGNLADVAVVWARLEDQIHGFLVETDRPGFTAEEMHGKLSLRASVTSELFLENVWIPAENHLPGSGRMKAPLSCLSNARYGISWGALGAAMSCYDTALEYAKGRVMFSRPIAGYQLVQRKLVEMITEITKGQLLALRLGRLKDAGKVRPEQISMAKMNNVSKALAIAREARDILGGNGIMDEYPIMRHMVNLETVNTYEGTEDVHRLIIGKDITGFDAFGA
ncbi:MAG: acyl-CoA dehydrogenase [Proteobacteria bacterium]|nr:MAG: acyl-CoA dehydrogenase [Pseudomonadota bacterium]